MDTQAGSLIGALAALVESSAIQTLLNSNNAPTDDMRRHLAAVRESARAHHASLTENIESLTPQPALQTPDAVQVAKGLVVLDAVLHPIRMIPHEIIDRICELAVGDPEVPLEDLQSPEVVDSLSMRHPSWTFSHVCRQWHLAVHNYPPCWTNIVISFDFRPVQSIKRVPLLMELMKRVRSFPLSISLHSLLPLSPHYMSLILQTCSRWRYACLSLNVDDFLVLAEMKHASVAGLKILAIDIHSRRYPMPLIDTFDEVQLDKLTLHNEIAVLPTTLPVLLSRVRHFVHEESVSIVGALQVLRLGTTLDSASLLLMVEFPPIRAIEMHPIRVEVRKLRLQDSFRPYLSVTIPTLLCSVSLPNLTELTLDTHSFSSLCDDRFPFGVGQSLHTLNLFVYDFRERESIALATFLKYATSLENLTMHLRSHADLEEVFCRASGILEDRPIESFTFSSGEYLDVGLMFGTGGAVRMISSLWRRGMLKSVSMRPLKNVRGDAATILKELAQSGLALDVRGVDGRSLLDEW